MLKYAYEFHESLLSFALTAPDNFILSPDHVFVESDGHTRATISCFYKLAPRIAILWGVIRGGIVSFVYNQSNGVIISSDTKTLTFDPVTQINEGNYYCFVPVSSTEDLCSDVVPLTILRELMVHFLCSGFKFYNIIR